MTKSRLITLVVLGLGLWAGAPSVRAELICPEPSFNAGHLLAGKPFKHLFALNNQGKEAIHILEALPSCGCLRPTLSKTILNPGEAITLPIEIHTLSAMPMPDDPHDTLGARARVVRKAEPLR
mgnify:CR=1 FL=1